jgi:hypothetical protein
VALGCTDYRPLNGANNRIFHRWLQAALAD